jgi:superfamily II DNA/RNA helicase
MNIVLVPLVSIIRSIQEECSRLQIICTKFIDEYTTPATIMVVHYNIDELGFSKLKIFIGKHYDRINGIFFDEAHLLNSWSDMMGTGKFVGVRGNLPLMYVFMSATMTDWHMQEIKRKMYVEDCVNIRLIDDNKQMEYRVIQQDNYEEALKSFVRCGEFEKLIIFVNTIEECGRYIRLVRGEYSGASFIFHGQLGLEYKERTLQEFEDTSKGIMVSTTALCAGYNNGSIESVLIMGNLYGFENVLQGMGRCGRRGQRCTSTLVISKQHINEDTFIRNNNILRTCFRVVVANYNGAFAVPCSGLEGYVECWYCRNFGLDKRLGIK